MIFFDFFDFKNRIKLKKFQLKSSIEEINVE